MERTNGSYLPSKMLEKLTRILMRDGNRSAAQKTLLKALIKLRMLAERGPLETEIPEREKQKASILSDTAPLPIRSLKRRTEDSVDP